ncbi:SRPBCC family protein [soil metagenome]
MATFERTLTIDADANRVFDYVSDIANLPEYMDQMTDAEPGEGESVKTTAVIDTGNGETRTVHGEAWFRVDDEARKIEWGSEGENDYHGQLMVSSADGSSSEVVMSMHTKRSEEDDVNGGLDQTLKNISNILESA